MGSTPYSQSITTNDTTSHNLLTEIRDDYREVNADSLDGATKIGQFLSKTGDGLGDIQINENFTLLGPLGQDYYIQAVAGKMYVLTGLVLLADFAGTYRGEWYDGSAALAQGMDIFTTISAVEASIINNLPIKTANHWSRFCYELTPRTLGAGNNGFSVRWTFGFSRNIELNGDNSDRLTLRAYDNMVGLAEHTIFIEGYQYDL